jgi:hypothetical protein
MHICMYICIYAYMYVHPNPDVFIYLCMYVFICFLTDILPRHCRPTMHACVRPSVASGVSLAIVSIYLGTYNKKLLITCSYVLVNS